MSQVSPANSMAPVKWTESEMALAVGVVRSKIMGLRKASQLYNVPLRTLRDHVAGTLREKPGRPPVFTREEEEDLVTRMKRLSEIGYGLTPDEVKIIVFQYCSVRRIRNPFNKEIKQAGRKWLKAFLDRNKAIRVRPSDKLPYARGQKLNKQIVREYIDHLASSMEKRGLLERPELVFNASELSVQLASGKSPRVFDCKTAKRVHQQEVPSKIEENVSLMCAGNALGTYIPPFIVYKGTRLEADYGTSLPPGSKVVVSETGNFNSNVFLEWLEHFQRFRPTGNVLLLLDGHRSHICEEVADKVDELNVELLCFPSNTTHELQPLDKAFFGAFETLFISEVTTFMKLNPGQAITKGPVFEEIVSAAFSRSAKPATLFNSFRVTGIFPPNLEAIDEEAFLPAAVTERGQSHQVPAKSSSAKKEPEQIVKPSLKAETDDIVTVKEEL